MEITMIIGIVIGAVLGGGIGWLVKTLLVHIKIKNLESEINKLKLEKRNLVDKLEQMTQKLAETESLLSDTLAAMEVMRAYNAIDEETKRKVKEVKDTLDDDGKTTPETIKKYKQLIDDINKKNKDYNSGNPDTDGAVL
jgi:chromosome segregation ATPase